MSLEVPKSLLKLVSRIVCGLLLVVPVIFTPPVANADTLGSSSSSFWTKWRVSNMRYCGGKPPQVVFDGVKSIVSVSKDHPCTLSHTIAYADLKNDRFVLRLGKVSAGVTWRAYVITGESKPRRYQLISGSRGGMHCVPFARLQLPRWLDTTIQVHLSSEGSGTAEILAWEIQSPGKDPGSEKQVSAYRKLVKANPLERGLVPHWSVHQGAFVCAYNATHPEHYNFWLEDEGEALWSLGNYPAMMELYGKALRDFIVARCKFGIPVRRVNDQPLILREPPQGGRFALDTGLLLVEGRLSADPQINLHHSTYESHGLLARIANFRIEYTISNGSPRSLKFAKPVSWLIRPDSPIRDATELVVRSEDALVSGEFRVVAYRGVVRIYAGFHERKLARHVKSVRAVFELVDCERYYRSPLNSVKSWGNVTLLWSEQPRLEFCNVVRVAGPAAGRYCLQRKGSDISRATFSAVLSNRGEPREIASIHAGSRSFAAQIDAYKDIAFDDADISMPFVNTYPLLGLATYCYRFPGDTEARRVAELMMDNFFAARERLRSRELGYLAWALDLLGRRVEAETVADIIEKRAVTESYTPHDMAGMAIGLRRLGRWEAADRICAALDKAWTGVGQPADFLALGATRSPDLLTRCLSQLSAGLRNMVWDAPSRLTFHSHTYVEEAASEAQSYMLVVFDLISQMCNGIVPVRLGLEPATEIKKLDFDKSSSTCRIGLSNAGEIDIFTHYRIPTIVLWNNCVLPKDKWRYHPASGTVRVVGLDGSGELAIQVEGECSKDSWEPIDYIGLGKLH